MTDVLVVGDETLISVGIKMILESGGGLDVATTEWKDARSAVEQRRPAVVLLAGLREQITVLDQLQALGGVSAIAVLTTRAVPDLVLDALRGGACGFLLRDTQPEQLVAAVRALARGSVVLAPEASSVVMHAAIRPEVVPTYGSRAVERLKQLSDRDQSILRLLTAGLTNSEISKQVFLSTATVKEHVSLILAKLHVRNRVQAAVLACSAGLCVDEDGRRC
ncbi:response regulator transcription factor [Solwaraspora sp. WMMA2056]|uniref:LuxR C-terminal-related transcriptional regulator n=1 Tax=Solwaraspora sp. WMMA2056 TaxID=3015161 RepID=UPI00259B67FB|nr:response regulator transcription factor [Solwaraspora sp. WMMA2056]WJK42046.1 response regulator transcription factor [Solwaraspora sp. WMMA2056]